MKENSFNHSVKVPRLYKIAAKILEQVKTNRASIKDLIYQKKHPNVKALYALIAETLQHDSHLEYLLKESEILTNEARLDSWLARILITELLWGKKRLAGESRPVQTILNYHEKLLQLTANINDLKREKRIKKVTYPRFVRINTLVLSVSEAIDGFRDEGWIFVRHNCNTYNEFLEKIKILQEDQFTTDFHINDVLVFSPGTQFYNHAGYQNGSILLQDKASCIPVSLLNPTPKSTILDMCAAPGMKASQLAAHINNDGIIYAVEKDLRRFETLNKLIELTQSTCVKTVNRDVLTMTDQEFPNVDYILVDPSCSGSGMLNRLDCTDPEEVCDIARLEKLSCFQITLLKYAFRKFPSVKRVVYSTCSIYPEENELVVQDVLRSCPNFTLLNAKELLNNQWINTGSDEYENIGEKCLYSRPEIDLTNGFFVAVFERNENYEIKKHNSVEKSEMENTQEISQRKRKSNTFDEIDTKIKHKKKKREKSLQEEEFQESVEQQQNDEFNGVEEVSIEKSKKKKRSQKSESSEFQGFVEQEQIDESKDVEEVQIGKSKRKKKSQKSENSEFQESVEQEQVDEFKGVEEVSIEKPKKKKKSHKSENSEFQESVEQEQVDEFKGVEEVSIEKPKKKKKSHKSKNTDFQESIGQEQVDELKDIEELQTKKSKKKSHKSENSEFQECIEQEQVDELKDAEEFENKKTKKKSHKLEKPEFQEPIGQEQVDELKDAEEFETKKTKKKSHKLEKPEFQEPIGQEQVDELRDVEELQTKKSKKKSHKLENSEFQKSIEEERSDELKDVEQLQIKKSKKSHKVEKPEFQESMKEEQIDELKDVEELQIKKSKKTSHKVEYPEFQESIEEEQIDALKDVEELQIKKLKKKKKTDKEEGNSDNENNKEIELINEIEDNKDGTIELYHKKKKKKKTNKDVDEVDNLNITNGNDEIVNDFREGHKKKKKKSKEAES